MGLEEWLEKYRAEPEECAMCGIETTYGEGPNGERLCYSCYHEVYGYPEGDEK